MIVLLATLEDLNDRIPSKREVESHIEKCGYLNLTPELLEFYESKQEPAWKTELAQARRDAIDEGWLKKLIYRDAWEISEEGPNVLARATERLQTGKWNVNRLQYWSLAFRQRMGCP